MASEDVRGIHMSGKEMELKEKRKKRYAVSVAFIAVLFAMLLLIFLGPWAKSDIADSQVPTEPIATETERVPVETEETEVSEIVEEPEPELSLVMVGDMLIHTRVMQSGHREDGSYNYDHLFKMVGDRIAEADLAMVNQETILGGTELGLSSYPCFNSPFEVGDAEVNTGFDVILQATNHALDKGKSGLLNDINYWETNHPEIKYLGIFDSQEDQDNSVYVFEHDGIKVSILNYTYGTNGISTPSDMPFAVNYLDQDQMTRDIAKAKEMSDFVIVCPHWGTEYRLAKDSMQEKWTNFYLSQGVDLVIGTHPHVIEPIEWVSDEAGNKMLVYYSIGNFVNGTESYDGSPADRMVGGMAKVTLGRDENNEVYIKDYGVDTLVCHMATGTDYTVYDINDYTEELAAQNLILAQDSKFSLSYCREIANKVWPEFMN